VIKRLPVKMATVFLFLVISFSRFCFVQGSSLTRVPRLYLLLEW